MTFPTALVQQLLFFYCCFFVSWLFGHAKCNFVPRRAICVNFTYLYGTNKCSIVKNIEELCTYTDTFWTVKRFEPHVQAVNSVEFKTN